MFRERYCTCGSPMVRFVFRLTGTKPVPMPVQPTCFYRCSPEFVPSKEVVS